jgi:hypothetical protein
MRWTIWTGVLVAILPILTFGLLAPGLCSLFCSASQGESHDMGHTWCPAGLSPHVAALNALVLLLLLPPAGALGPSLRSFRPTLVIFSLFRPPRAII